MPKIKAYHHPSNLTEAIRLLSRPDVNTAVMGGGVYLTAHLDETVEEIVDLQSLGLNEINYIDECLIIGAMVNLQTLVEDAQVPTLLRETARQEGPLTFRNAGVVGGVIVGASKESELLAALLVFQAEVHIESNRGMKQVLLADFLRDVPVALNGGIVTAVSLTTTGKTASARVARTPADQPIVAAVARLDPKGQTYLALCGVARTPILVDPNNVKAIIDPPNDFRGSSEYRRQMAVTLAKRVIDEVMNQKGHT